MEIGGSSYTMTITDNPILLTDSYNVTHWQMRSNTVKDIAYLYNREAPIILFGLKGIVNKLYSMTVRESHVNKAEKMAKRNGIELDRDMWMNLVNNHGGKLHEVLRIEQLPEFCWYPKGTPIAKISNIVDGFAELVTYFEGYLTKCFYPSACLTNIYKYLEMGLNNIHNFGYRGHRTEQDAIWSDLAFALVYEGSDSFHINALIESQYNDQLPFIFQPYSDIISRLKINTIRAASHKIIQCAPTQGTAISTLISTNKGKTVAFPIDTYDSEDFINNMLDFSIYTAHYHSTNIMFRVDSGEKVRLVIEIIQAILKYKQEKVNINDKPIPTMGVIVSGNMTAAGAESIRKQVMFNFKKVKGFDVDNYVFFGVGGDVYNHANRDEIGMVMKLAWSNASGNTMKTTAGKESIPGNFSVYPTLSNEYFVTYDPVLTTLTSTVTDIQRLAQLREGNVFGKDFKLVLAPEIHDTIKEFKTRMLES